MTREEMESKIFHKRFDRWGTFTKCQEDESLDYTGFDLLDYLDRLREEEEDTECGVYAIDTDEKVWYFFKEGKDDYTLIIERKVS